MAIRKRFSKYKAKAIMELVRGKVDLEATVPGVYNRLLEHIDVHRWYLGEKTNEDVPYEQAVTSWHKKVYFPVVEFIHDHKLQKVFPRYSETDLYLWIIEYVGFVQQSYKRKEEKPDDQIQAATEKLISDYQIPVVRKLVKLIRKDDRINRLILRHEKNHFLERTRIYELRPGAILDLTIPGFYERLFEHIAVHRWYLGEQTGDGVEYSDAITSWYDNLYLPVIRIIREQGIMEEFPSLTETDIYIWIVDRRAALQESYGEEVPIEQAVEKINEDIDQ